MLSRVQVTVTPWTVAHQAPLSMGFFSAKNTRLCCYFLLQRIITAQGLNSCLLCLLHWQAENEMVGWHHRLNGHGFGWTLWVGDGQGGLECCSLWGCKKSDTTEQLNWTEWNRTKVLISLQTSKKLFRDGQSVFWSYVGMHCSGLYCSFIESDQL